MSLCVANFNGEALLRSSLESLFETRHPEWELLVADNASSDGSRQLIDELFEHAPSGHRRERVDLPRNLGYGGAQNEAARRARGKYLAFLTPSTRVEPEWLAFIPWLESDATYDIVQPLVAFPDEPEVVQSLGTCLAMNGSLTVLGRRRRLRPAAGIAPVVTEVFSVLGSSFVIRRSLFEALGGFDSRYFLYFEETDLCWRARLQGHRAASWYDPTRPCRVFHQVHGTSPDRSVGDQLFDRNRTITMLRYLERRHLPYLLRNQVTVLAELVSRPSVLFGYLAGVATRTPGTLLERIEAQRRRTWPDDRIFLRPPVERVEPLFTRPDTSTHAISTEVTGDRPNP